MLQSTLCKNARATGLPQEDGREVSPPAGIRGAASEDANGMPVFQLTCEEPGCCVSLRLRPEQLGLEPVTLESVNMHEVRAVPSSGRAGCNCSHASSSMHKFKHHASCCRLCGRMSLAEGGLCSHDKAAAGTMKHLTIAVAFKTRILGVQVDMEQVQLAPVSLQEVRQRRPAWEGSWAAQSRSARPRVPPAAPAARNWATQQSQGSAMQPGRDRSQQCYAAPDDGYQDSGRGRAGGSTPHHSPASLPSLEQQVAPRPASC